MSAYRTLALAAILVTSACLKANAQQSGAVIFMATEKAVQKNFSLIYDTLTIAPHERVADIGDQGGNIMPVLDYKYDSLDVTLEDISSQWLNPVRVDSVTAYYNRLFGKISTNRYSVVIGNDSSTTLPDAYFDKIFFVNTYHECSQKDKMVRELNRICAPGGLVILVEVVSKKAGKTRNDCHHIMPTNAEIQRMFKANGFSQVAVYYRNPKKSHTVVTYRFRKNREVNK